MFPAGICDQARGSLQRISINVAALMAVLSSSGSDVAISVGVLYISAIAAASVVQSSSQSCIMHNA